jgi:hypothetical protein
VFASKEINWELNFTDMDGDVIDGVMANARHEEEEEVVEVVVDELMTPADNTIQQTKQQQKPFIGNVLCEKSNKSTSNKSPDRIVEVRETEVLLRDGDIFVLEDRQQGNQKDRVNVGYYVLGLDQETPDNCEFHVY